MNELQPWIVLAGVMQLLLSAVTLLSPIVMEWEAVLRPVGPLVRQVVWLRNTAFAFVEAGFGALALLETSSLVDGAPLARGVCALMAAFWAFRLAAQCFWFNGNAEARMPEVRIGYRLFALTFAYLTAVFAVGACGS